MVSGYTDANKKFHPFRSYKNVRGKRDSSKKTEGIKINKNKGIQSVRLRRDLGIPEKLTGLNHVTIMELKKGGRSYEPRLFQVNVNGKGAYFPAVKEVVIDQAKSMIESAKSADKRRVKLNK